MLVTRRPNASIRELGVTLLEDHGGGDRIGARCRAHEIVPSSQRKRAIAFVRREARAIRILIKLLTAS